MYDILQLNDMLVPELQDIAEQLAIPNFKKIERQDLVYKILDTQSIMSAEKKNGEQWVMHDVDRGAQAIKAVNPSIKITFVGPPVTTDPDRALILSYLSNTEPKLPSQPTATVAQ